MLKRGSSGARNAGLEPYSEYYASNVIKHFTDNYVSYDLRTHNNRICSVCDIFTSEDYGFIPYAAIDTGNASLELIIEKASELGFEDEIKEMFVIDAVIMNADRHKNNFGFIKFVFIRKEDSRIGIDLKHSSPAHRSRGFLLII